MARMEPRSDCVAQWYPQRWRISMNGVIESLHQWNKWKNGFKVWKTPIIRRRKTPLCIQTHREERKLKRGQWHSDLEWYLILIMIVLTARPEKKNLSLSHFPCSFVYLFIFLTIETGIWDVSGAGAHTLLNQHVSELGESASAADARPQWRDQHPARQRQLHEGAYLSHSSFSLSFFFLPLFLLLPNR